MLPAPTSIRIIGSSSTVATMRANGTRSALGKALGPSRASRAAASADVRPAAVSRSSAMERQCDIDGQAAQFLRSGHAHGGALRGGDAANDGPAQPAAGLIGSHHPEEPLAQPAAI